MSENRTRFRLDQRRAPIYEALEQFRQMRVVPFDVPGHKERYRSSYYQPRRG